MSQPNLFRKEEFKELGTDIYVKIILKSKEGQKKADADLKIVKKIYHKFRKILSRFEDSELSRLNNNIEKYIEASADILYLARRCLHYYAESKGYFDPRILESLEALGYDRDFKKVSRNSRKKITYSKISGDLAKDLKIKGNRVFFGRPMDFNGIAKGYITDKVSGFLKKNWDNFLVDSGGDIYASGLNQDNQKWKIAVEGKEDLLVEISNLAVATSGRGRRKWTVSSTEVYHIINPHNPGSFPAELFSVTVLGENNELADVWAKILFIWGKASGLKYCEKHNIRAIFLDNQGQAEYSSAAEFYLKI